MHAFSLSAGAVTRSSHKHNDDRHVLRLAEGVFAVADASGPTYDGHHVPIAADQALRLLADAATAGPPGSSGEEALRLAFAKTGDLLRGYEEAHRVEFEAEIWRGTADRLTASLRASQKVARVHFAKEIRAFIHFATSVTALSFRGGGVTVGHVGNGRAHRSRGGAVALLARDQTLATLTGNPRDSAPLRTLGLGSAHAPEMATFDVAPGDAYLLLTDGAWPGLPERELATLAAATGEGADALARRAVATAEREHHDDMTVLAVTVAA